MIDPTYVHLQTVSCLLLACQAGNPEVVQFIGTQIKTKLGPKKFLDFLRQRDENGQTVEQIIVKNKTLEKIIKTLKK